MGTQITEDAVWASGMAARLRVLQANGGETAPAMQREFIAEELERGLKDVVPSRRRQYLQALADRFPVWQVAAISAQPTAKAEIVEDTPDRRLEALLQVASKLPPEQLKEYSARLKAAGFAVVEGGTGAVQSNPELQKAIGSNDPHLDPDRAVKMLALTVTLGLMIDQLVWGVWKQLAPKSVISKPQGDLKTLMRRYLAGDPDVSTQQVSQVIEQCRRLAASLLMSVGGAGRQFAKKHQERFSPQEITELAKMEKKAWEALDKRCWEKYAELFREFGDEAAIDGEIQQAIVKYAEQVMHGAKANL